MFVMSEEVLVLAILLGAVLQGTHSCAMSAAEIIRYFSGVMVSPSSIKFASRKTGFPRSI